MFHYIGVDPGKNGCIAVLSLETTKKVPLRPTITLSGTLGMMDAYDILEFLSSFQKNSFAVLEQVHAGVFGKGGKMGVTSAFTFGKGVGLLIGVLSASEIPFSEVSPRTWQSFLKCTTKGDKNVTKQKAKRLYPQAKITHATADALLLATYCLKAHQQGLL